MSLRETVDRRGAEISAHYASGSYCSFAPAEETLGFIDTSAKLDKSRGIVFLCDRLRVSGEDVCQLYYSDITAVEVILSGEDEYADELVIHAHKNGIRIQDCSLNKRALKALIDELRLAVSGMTEEALEQECAETTAEAARHFSEEPEQSTEQESPAPEERAFAYVEFIEPPEEAAEPEEPTEQESPIPEERAYAYVEFVNPPEQAAQPDKIAEPEEAEPKRISESENALSEAPTEEIPANAPQSAQTLIAERRNTPSVDEILDELDSKNKPAEPPVVPEEFEPDEDLQDMTHEETLSYLLSSISEINHEASDEDAEFDAIAPDPAVFRREEQPAPEQGEALAEPPAEPEDKPTAEADSPQETAPEPPETPQAPASLLTIEPLSDDIYIKASRKLREFCDEGRLSRGQITAALKDNLICAAEAFAEITAAADNIPEGIAPKIAELRAASDSLPSYFALGEDVAERVMFFMMYQMLSYSDRIAETPETKERLNDFFRRYGPSGITLSMLDMRIQ